MDKLSYDANHVYREGYNDAFMDFCTMIEKTLDERIGDYGCECMEAYCDALQDLISFAEVRSGELKLLQS